MKFDRRYIPMSLALSALLFSAIMVGCNNSTDKRQAKATEQLMAEANQEIGLPNISHFAQKKTMKLIQEECDRTDLICYAYLYVEMTGDLKFLGKCVGYGVPFSAQFTSPMKYVSRIGAAMPQPDPNGLYMPASSNATWLLLIDPKTNKPGLIYAEPNIIVSPFRLH